MAALGFDIANPEIVGHELEEANRRLAREELVPDSILNLVADVAEALSETSPADRAHAGVDPESWIELQSAAMRALRALREEDERVQRRQLRMRIEEMRFRLARIAEHERVSDERPIDEIVRWLDATLTVSQTQKAHLVGVHDRTWQRWISETEMTQPSGDDERRLRLIARVVHELRHLLTAVGVIDWLQRPNAQLDEQAPVELIAEGDSERVHQLFAVVQSARSGAAA